MTATAGRSATGARGPSADLRGILGIQALRALLYGFGSVLIGSALARAGYSDAQVGLVLSAMLAGAAIVSVVVGTVGDRWGRRHAYATLFAAMAVAGTVFALTDQLWALILAALTGTISVEANESGPITSLETAMIAHTTDPSPARNRAFARYNAIAFLAGSVGALLAGGPALFRRSTPSLPADQRFLLIYLPVAVVCMILALRLSPAVEAGEELSVRKRFPLLRSRRTVAKLSALFALDAFGGGFVVQSFVVFWFERRFGAGVGTMGLVFFIGGILQGLSSLAAGRWPRGSAC